jgi:tripartite-type tricarboxylate transporter receptor subunit TctC
VGQKVGESLGQQMVIENRGGAGGSGGARAEDEKSPERQSVARG